MLSLGKFEWDPAKAASNLRKHRVSFAEAMECFLDPHGIELADVEHAGRFVLIGYSKAERLLTVVYAERVERGILRVISARRATPHEKKLYQDEP